MYRLEKGNVVKVVDSDYAKDLLIKKGFELILDVKELEEQGSVSIQDDLKQNSDDSVNKSDEGKDNKDDSGKDDSGSDGTDQAKSNARSTTSKRK